MVSPPQPSRPHKINVEERQEGRLKKEFDVMWGSKRVIWSKDLSRGWKVDEEMCFREKGESLRGRESGKSQMS